MWELFLRNGLVLNCSPLFFLEGVVHYGGWIKRGKGELCSKSQSAAKAGSKKNDAAKCLCSCLVIC